MEIILFQTLADRDNADEIEQDGPFICTRGDAWMGDGYYFWDSHLELAHFWGRYWYGEEYVICSAKGRMDSSLFDLVGNGQHRIAFSTIEKEAAEKYPDKTITVRDVILFATGKGWLKDFKGVRLLGSFSIYHSPRNRDFYKEVPFDGKPGKSYFFDMWPPIQLCLFIKNAISLCNYKIVHPVKYVQD